MADAAQPVRMIALDLDGTLLRSDHSIGARSIAALRAANARGVEIVLASGRMTPAMETAAAQLGLDVCLVSYNGAVICGRGSPRRRLFDRPLNAAVARELFQYARDKRCQVNFYHQDMILSEDAPHLRPWIELYRGRTGSPFRFVENLEAHLHEAPTKLLFVMDPAQRNGVEAELRPRLGRRAEVIRTDPEYLEFLDPDVDKGKGVRRLAQMLEIPLAAVMAIGDGDNDVTMLQAAGWSVAVANAGKNCRAAARYITQSDHNHDAVAEAVEKWA